MATTSKKNINEEVSSDVVENNDVEVKAPVVKKVKKYAPDDMIECRSITAGLLVYNGAKSKLHYSWADYGDTAFVEYQDLQSLQSSKSPYLTRPCFIIEDDELVEQWGNMLNPIYNKIAESDLDKFFAMAPSKIKKVLEQYPIGMKNTIKSRAASMVESGELYDIRVAKAIDEVVGSDLVDQMSH